MTTLAQVNETLEMHTPLLEDSRDGIVKLEDSFSKFFMGSLDDLESRREAMGSGTSGAPTAGQVQTQQQEAESNGLFSRIFDGLSNALSFAAVAGLFKALMKRGIFGIAALTLADEIGEYVKKMSGSDLLGDITEKGIVYASIGAMLFGKKGLIAGAILGAVTVFSDKIAKSIEDHEMAGEYSYAIGQGASALFTIGSAASVGFLLAGPMGALVAAVGAGALEITNLVSRYKTDKKFRSQVDGILDEVTAAIDSLLGKVADTVNMIFDGAIRTKQERIDLQNFNPALYDELVQNEKELALAVSKYNRLVSTGAPASQIEAARLEMMGVKEKRSEIESRIRPEEDAIKIIKAEGEFGPGAANPYVQPKAISDITAGRDLTDIIKRIAIESGENEGAAAQIAAAASQASKISRSGEEGKEAALATTARLLGIEILELRQKINQLETKQTPNVINAPTTDASKTEINSQMVSQQSGPTIDLNDQIAAAKKRVSGRP